MNWEGAICANRVDLFFSDKLADIELAKEMCDVCPQFDRCRTVGFEQRELYGIWGGLTYWDRITIDPHFPRRDSIDHGTNRGFDQHKALGIDIEEGDPCGCLEARRANARERMARYRARKKMGPESYKE